MRRRYGPMLAIGGLTVNEIVFLSLEDVVIIQASAIEHEGGMEGMRDHGLLDAVAMPRQQFAELIYTRI